MAEKHNLLVQQEISQNMSVASQQPFAMSNEEMAFNAMMANSRNNRKRNKDEKADQQRNTQAWINQTQSNNIMQIGLSGTGNSGIQSGSEWMRNVNREALQTVHQNNKASSESLDTLRENFRNSQEMLKRRSCETMTIEEAHLRDRSNSTGSNELPKRHSMPDFNSKGDVNKKCMENKRNQSANNLTIGRNGNVSSDTLTIKESPEGCVNEDNVLKSNMSSSECVDMDKSTTSNNKNTSTNVITDPGKNVNENVLNENCGSGTSDNTVTDGDKMSYESIAVSDSRSAASIPSRNCRDSMESLTESTYDLSRSYRSISLKDPHTAAIELSNNCRKFYFSHRQNAEVIKQAVRTAKHTRAKEKMAGKTHSSIDDAFDRLRSEVADLMDQDLSLMSQLLKLNDKIEEVKAHVAYRTRPESYDSSQSTWEASDSEFEENDDSRLDLSLSARNFSFQDVKSLVETQEAEPKKEVVLQRLMPADSRIIVYTKKARRKKRSKRNRSRTETDDESGEETEDATEDDEQSGSESDTESTLSDYSGTTIGSNHSGGIDRTSDNVDSGIQSPNSPAKQPEIPKPVVGGVSQNRKFLSFLKKNGNFNAVSEINTVLTKQGHNIPVDKFFVPQGLVYLKHTNSDNVFCQFSK